MNNFRTSSLFHYTSFNYLKRILNEGIIPNYCKEDLSYANKEHIIGFPMVSFCDIPLTRTHVFTSRYGNFAIGLSKAWAIRSTINPILYISNEDVISSLYFYKAYETSLRSDLENIGSDGRSIKIDLKDDDSVSNLVPFINHRNSYDANRNLFGYVKKYESIGKDNKKQCNYEENEWRYVVRETENIKWLWDRAAYESWRGNDSKPAPTADLVDKRLKFEASDVTHILVEYERQTVSIINYIEKLTQIGGTGKQINDDERKALYSKVISMEKIKSDF